MDVLPFPSKMDHSRSTGQRRPAGVTGKVPKYRPAHTYQPKRPRYILECKELASEARISIDPWNPS